LVSDDLGLEVLEEKSDVEPPDASDGKFQVRTLPVGDPVLHDIAIVAPPEPTRVKRPVFASHPNTQSPRRLLLLASHQMLVDVVLGVEMNFSLV